MTGSVDTKFLKDIQKAGWSVVSATDTEVIGQCGNVNCQLRAKLTEGSFIPSTCEGRSHRVFEPQIFDLQSWIEVLRDRRQQLCLSIRDVEAVIGHATDSVAKYESQKSDKVPTVEFMFLWSQAVGLDFLARPTNLSNYAVRIISETRGQIPARTKRFSLEARRRGKLE